MDTALPSFTKLLSEILDPEERKSKIERLPPVTKLKLELFALLCPATEIGTPILEKFLTDNELDRFKKENTLVDDAKVEAKFRRDKLEPHSNDPRIDTRAPCR